MNYNEFRQAFLALRLTITNLKYKGKNIVQHAKQYSDIKQCHLETLRHMTMEQIYGLGRELYEAERRGKRVITLKLIRVRPGYYQSKDGRVEIIRQRQPNFVKWTDFVDGKIGTAKDTMKEAMECAINRLSK